jgi:hypothetical protein
MTFEEIYKKVLDAKKKFKELGIPINLDFKFEDLCSALIDSKNKIEELIWINKKLEDAINKVEERELGYYNDWKEMFETFSPIKAERDALRKENAYLRRLALHAMSGWAIGMSLVNHLDERGSRKKQIAYFMVSKKFENLHKIEKDKWRKEKERSNINK